VTESAYGCGTFVGLGGGMTMTTRARANGVFYHLAPPRTGKRGRPRRKANASAYQPISARAAHPLGLAA
jgi:hypothetical protein